MLDLASANGGKDLRGFGHCSRFSAGMQPGNLTSADTKNYFYLKYSFLAHELLHT